MPQCEEHSARNGIRCVMEAGHEPIPTYVHNYGGLGPYTPEYTSVTPSPSHPPATIDADTAARGKPVTVHWTWDDPELPDWWQVWLPISMPGCSDGATAYAYVSWGGPQVRQALWFELLKTGKRTVYVGEVSSVDHGG